MEPVPNARRVSSLGSLQLYYYDVVIHYILCPFNLLTFDIIYEGNSTRELEKMTVLILVGSDVGLLIHSSVVLRIAEIVQSLVAFDRF